MRLRGRANVYVLHVWGCVVGVNVKWCMCTHARRTAHSAQHAARNMVRSRQLTRQQEADVMVKRAAIWTRECVRAAYVWLCGQGECARVNAEPERVCTVRTKGESDLINCGVCVYVEVN